MQRARPWLGTLVEMRVEGLAENTAVDAIEAAFAEVATVHARMSFHESGSDLCRLHAAQVDEPIVVDARTYEVLGCAVRIADSSEGCFDPTIAARLVADGMLPRPPGAAADAQATWRDLQLLGHDRVLKRKALWIDLGGIAKGYAVDRAVDALIARGAQHIVVNAGGDLRVAGSREEMIHLRGAGNGRASGMIGLSNAGLASSAGAATRRPGSRGWVGTHLHGRRLRSVGTFSSVSVIAATCMVADALTKVVLAERRSTARRILNVFDAGAVTHSARHGWHRIGVAA